MNIDIHYRKPFLFAAILHALLFIFLFVHFVTKPASVAATNTTNPINATAVSQSQLQQQLDAIQAVKQAAIRQKQEQQKLQAQQEQAQAGKLKAQQEQLQAEQQQQKLQQQKIQQAQIQQKEAAELKLQQQAQAQHQQILKQQQAEQLAAQKAAAAVKQKQLQAAQAATQKLLQQEIADSPAATTAKKTSQNTALSAANAAEIDKYKALIIQAISQQWNVPQDPQNNQDGKLLVKVAPGGMVLSVEIVQSSGDDALDRSARIAVLKASPLPVPADPSIFNKFRELNLIVQPQGIVASE